MHSIIEILAFESRRCRQLIERLLGTTFLSIFVSVFLPVLVSGLFSVVCPRVAFAQYAMIEDLAPRFEWRGRIGMDYLNEFETDTDGGDEFDSWRLALGGDVGGPVNESILVGFHARYQRAEYDFNLDNGPYPSTAYGTNELPKEPWGGLDTIDLMPTTTILIGSRFSVVAAVPIRWSGEVGAERNAFAAGIAALAGWQVTDGLRIGFGYGVTSQIEGSAESFPVLALDWQINDSLRLATEGNWIQGGSTGLYWGPNQALALAVSVGYERNRFRLDNNGTTPDTNGVGEVTAVPIEVGIRIRFAGGAHFDLRLGLGVAGRFRVEDDRGDKLYDQNYDPAPRLRAAFMIPIGRSAAVDAESDASNSW
jgi:hypothetical protein